MEAQKSSQAMQHSIPKRTSSSGACSRPRPVPTQQTAKLTPATPEDRGRSHSARHYLFAKRQGPQPRSPWIKRFRSPSDQPGRKRRGLSLATAGPPRKQPLMCASPHSELGAEESLPAISVLPVCSQSLEMFQPQGRYRPSAQSFPDNAGTYASGFAGTSVGSASHATHPVLAEAEGSISSLASWTPPRNGDSGLYISPGPLKGPPLDKARRDLRYSTQKEGCHNRRFQQGLGSAVRGQTDLRSLVRRGVGPAHQLPRNASSVPCLSILPAGHTGTPCASTIRQQFRNVGKYLAELK